MYLGGMGKINKMDDKKTVYGEILSPELIKTNRIRRGMSQRDLAKLINVDKSTISHWENGRNKVNLKTAPLLYDVLTNPNTYMRGEKQK